MSKYVLDASAILALLNNETGAGIVQKMIPNAVVSAVNHAEVVTRLSLLGMPENEIRDTLNILGLEVIPFTEELSFLTGTLANVTRQYGLSLGDRACLTLALQTEAAAITSDKVWKDINVGVVIEVIR